MKKKELDREPVTDNTYQTGNTQPPKNRNGLITVLLILVIFLCGLSTWLGLLNVHLFRMLQEDEVAVGETGAMPAPASFARMGVENGLIPTGNYRTAGIFPVRAVQAGTEIRCTAVAISDYLVTAGSAVKDAESITVSLTEDDPLTARLIGWDALSDLAVLQVEESTLTPAEYREPCDVQEGEAVTAIWSGTPADGILCAIRSEPTYGARTMHLLRTDITFDGDSLGAPLLDPAGQVIGIHTRAIGATEADDCAVPMDLVREIAEAILKKGTVPGSPSLGFTGYTVPLLHQAYDGLPRGVYVTEADPAGVLQTKDVITAVGDRETPDLFTLETALYDYPAGTAVPVTVYRDGETLELTLEVSGV